MPLAAFATGAAVALLVLRLLLWVVRYIGSRKARRVSTMIVLGSGGHTAEMMALLQGFDLSVYQPRCYVVAATDAMSGQKAAAFEAAAATSAAAAANQDEEAPPSASKTSSRTPGKGGGAAAGAASSPVRRSPRVAAASRHQHGKQPGGSAGSQASQARKALPGARSPESPAKRRLAAGAPPQHHRQQRQQAYSVVTIPRSREVGQSFLSSIPTTLRALWAAVAVVLDHQPDLVLLNGPGTCIPIAAAAFFFRLLGLCGGKVVYVESIARVYRLSLSGKILYHSRLAHTFFVQWEELKQRYPRAVYAGRLM